MSVSTGTRLGPYEVLGQLGKGGMGEVYRAFDPRLRREVAVKILPETVSRDLGRIARFEMEARALAALSHPNILDIHDFGQSHGRLYVVTELLHGESLRDRMSGETLTWRKSAELAAAIADGLSCAHTARIVHRDLKPENVFVTSDGHVKILDFGLAKSTEPVSEDAVTSTSPPGGAVSADGEVVGTVSYMAPEQLRGLQVDGRADIFALGCILFEMLSGKRPFVRATRADTLSAILRGEPDGVDLAASRTPPALAGIVLRCLEKRPEDRFDTAHDLALALRSACSVEQTAVPSSRVSRSARRLWIAAIAAVVAALAAVGVLLKWSPLAPARGFPERTEPPLQITSSEGRDAEPALSPDGTLVAYSSDAAGNSNIWLVDARGGEPMRLTDGPGEEGKPAWFPDGRSLAYVSIQGGKASVWRAPRLGGSPLLLAEDADMPAISPDGKRIAFVRLGPGGQRRIWTAPLEHPTDARRLTGDDGGLWDHMDPAWSPDGSRICYSDFRNLWVIALEGGKPRQLTTDDEVNREPAWSGSSVYCSSMRGGIVAIWRIPLDGKTPVRISTGAGPQTHPAVSRDESRLVYSSAFSDQSVDILVIDRTRGTSSRFGSALTDAMPAIAPDGSLVAYASDRLGKFDLWQQPLTDGRPSPGPAKRLTDLETAPVTPAFSPDGQWIAYVRAVKGQRDIWMLPARGGTPVRITTHPGRNVHPAFSPDGSQLAFVSNRSGLEHVWILPLRGASANGEPWQLTDGEEVDKLPNFSPSGDRLLFVRNGEIWVTRPSGGAACRQVTTGAEIHYATWDADGQSLLATGMWGTSTLRIRRVRLETGATEPLAPDVGLGNRDAPGYFSLTRDGRYLAVDIADTKGNLWTIGLSGGHS